MQYTWKANILDYYQIVLFIFIEYTGIVSSHLGEI
jgi:hypothetical protein